MNWWAALIGLVGIVVLFDSASAFLPSDCNATTYGNGPATITYFSSPLCVACWTQKATIKDTVALEGNNLTINEYNVDLCAHKAAPHAIRGVPAFIANDRVVYGYQDARALRGLA